MRRTTLTETAIARIRPPDKGRVEKYDAALPGFGVRAYAKTATSRSPAKSWLVLYGTNGSRRRFTFGTVAGSDEVATADPPEAVLEHVLSGRKPVLSLSQARRVAALLLAHAQNGQDLALEQERRMAEARTGDKSFTRAVDDFITEYVKPSLTARGQKEAKRPLEQLKKEWGRRDLVDIGRLDLIDYRDRMKRNSGPYAAERSLSVLKRFFRWCVDKGRLEVSPAQLVVSPIERGERRSRDRYLTDPEIAILWAAFLRQGYPVASYMQMLLVTGQRRSEVAGMRWDEIDLDEKTWTLPRERTKSNREHIVPLSSLALDILDTLPRFKKDDKGSGTFVFSSREGRIPISGFSKAKKSVDTAVADNATEKELDNPVGPWRLHDLRRTAATKMASMKKGHESSESLVPPHVLAAILNHSPGSMHGVTAIYNRYEYLAEKRSALEAWANRLQLITDDTGKVIPITEGTERTTNSAPMRKS
jgi:integrase